METETAPRAGSLERKTSNKRDDLGQLDVADIHQVNRHDNRKAASTLYDIPSRPGSNTPMQSIWEAIAASELARHTPLDAQQKQPPRILNTSAEAMGVGTEASVQSPMVTTDVFGIPRSVDRGTGSMAGKTNKKDGWASFQTADIHRVNRHIPAKGAGALYDNVHAASDAPTVWEWEAQSQAGRAGPKERRVDVYPAYSAPATEKPAAQVASSAPSGGTGARGMERWLGRTSAGLSRDASQDLDRTRSGEKTPMADLSMPYSA